LRAKPNIPALEENNARQGFLSHDDFMKLRAELPQYLKDPIEFLYRSGWRVGEMKTLEWRDVDLANKVVRLRPEVSKNKHGRLLPLRDELLDIFTRAKENRKLECPRVFHHRGKPIGDFRKAWNAALEAAELAHLFVHDLRRTAIRNFVKSGVREGVAMALSGHKTRSVFDRYAIIDDADLVDAMDKVQAHLKAVTTVRDSGKAKA
jgi:integrase